MSDPFNVPPYAPFTRPANNTFWSNNDCTTWATCTSSQVVDIKYLPQGQNMQVIYGVDLTYQPIVGPNGVGSMFELIMQEDSKPYDTLVRVYSRPTGFTNSTELDGALQFNGTATVMTNYAVTMLLSGGSTYRWGFRARGANGQPADDFYTTRVFFGCVGPKYSMPLTYTVTYLQDKLRINSGITEYTLPDGSTMDAQGWVGVFPFI